MTKSLRPDFMARNIGPFEVITRLAVGGEAEIYLARLAGSNPERQFALKVLLPHRAEDPAHRKMMVDEARLTSQFDHPNIVKVHQLGEDEDTLFIVMEHVQGLNLAQVLARAHERDERMPVEVAAYIAREMCSGLHYAHTRQAMDGTHLQLVHRDVSPQNLLVGFTGEVKLIDFGVAKASIQGRIETKTGIIKGKLAYMAPEYALGSQQDRRSDIFATGLCLYEMLVGQAAYDLADARDVVEAVKRARIQRPSELRADIPEELERILARALEERPESRWDSAEAMGDQLTAFLARFKPDFSREWLAAWLVHLRDESGTASARPRSTEPGMPALAQANDEPAVSKAGGGGLLGLSDLRSMADAPQEGPNPEDELSVLATVAMQPNHDHDEPSPAKIRREFTEGLDLDLANIPTGAIELVELGRNAEMPTVTNIDVGVIRGDIVQRVAQPDRPQILTMTGFQRLATRDILAAENESMLRPTEPLMEPFDNPTRPTEPDLRIDPLTVTGPMDLEPRVVQGPADISASDIEPLDIELDYQDHYAPAQPSQPAQQQQQPQQQAGYAPASHGATPLAPRRNDTARGFHAISAPTAPGRTSHSADVTSGTMSEAREQRALAHGKKSGSSKELLVVAVLGIVFVLMVLFVIFAT